MDDHKPTRSDDQPADPSEGVRLIDADEAAEAMERGDVTPRRTDDELRYGDRPPSPPEGVRPALRFPLDASADPSRIERPPVQPAPDPVTGPVAMPHWTEPPTGEVPAVLINDDGPILEDDDDLADWSSFTTSAPRWRDSDDDWGDDDFVEQLASASGEVRMGALANDDAEPSHEEYFGFDDMEERVEERMADQGVGPRLDIGGDDWSASDEAFDDDVWEDEEVWEDEPQTGEVVGAGQRGGEGGGYGPPQRPDNGGRNMPVAIAVGAGLALLVLVTLKLGTALAAVLVTAVLVLCAIEYFSALRQVGWEAATAVGTVAVAALPLAVYWRGLDAVSLAGFLTIATVLCWYLVGGGGEDPRVLEGTGATLLGVFWIGGLGASASAMLLMPEGRGLFIVAILATVGYDVGGLFIGQAIGHRPLSSASPNKTIEGLFAGMGCALLVTIFAVVGGLGPWGGMGAALVLGIGAAVAAPLGDLCQSILKRDLGVKDMGTLLPGHGGMLDRVDAMLFVMPMILWLTLALGS